MAINRKKITMDGNEAASYVAYAFSEFSGIYPITPSSAMADLIDQWSNQNKKNIFKSLLIASLINIGIVFFTYAVLGKSIIDMVDFSEFFVLRKIGLQTGSNRIDSFIILEWLLCLFALTSCSIFFIRNFIQYQFKRFKLNYTFIITILIFIISLNIFRNVTTGKLFILKTLPNICFFTLFVLNFIIFIILKIKKKPNMVS